MTTIEPRFRTIDGLKIRYAESEPHDVDALLLCPWPESLFAFEPTWTRLAQHAHLVAVDLPGFGHSERRDDLLSPRAMGEFIIRLADAFGLEQPHAVGPDVGTAALLFAAASYPDRLRSLVLGSGGVAYPLELGGALKDRIEAPDLDRFRRGDPRQMVAASLAKITGYAMPAAIREDYLSAYEGDRFVESMRYVRSYPQELPILRDRLADIATPVHIINGARDDVVPPVNAEYLNARLPNSKLSLIDAGHFIWEIAPDEYAALVIDWWRDLTTSSATRHNAGQGHQGSGNPSRLTTSSSDATRASCHGGAKLLGDPKELDLRDTPDGRPEAAILAGRLMEASPTSDPRGQTLVSQYPRSRGTARTSQRCARHALCCTQAHADHRRQRQPVRAGER